MDCGCFTPMEREAELAAAHIGDGGGVVVGREFCETLEPRPESEAPESMPDSETERRASASAESAKEGRA